MEPEEGLRRAAASTEGVASPVGIWEKEAVAEPQAGQNRLSRGNSAEQDEHCMAEW
jgi:hypothetical protein